MFNLPTESTAYRIIGIDPGSDTLGFAVLEIDLLSGESQLLEASTFSGYDLRFELPHVLEIHGARHARIWGHQQNLERQFKIHRPDTVLSESPFMGKFPQAFATLTEVMTAIRRSIYLYDPLMPLETVDPPTVKQAVGVKAKKTDKNDVKIGLLKIDWLNNPHEIDLESLDEHSVDAICVALTKINSLRTSILLANELKEGLGEN